MVLSDIKGAYGWVITRKLTKLYYRLYMPVDWVAIVAQQQPITK
jgi:hypothetical protein